MTVEEVDFLFEVNEEDRFVHLIIPKEIFGEEMNLIGKKRMELSLHEIILVKKYAGLLYEEALNDKYSF